jgi:DNA-binding protein inhibitor ID2
MKANCATAKPADYGVKVDKFRIAKPCKEPTEAEMQACFSKLKDLVPTVPEGQKITKVQLLQHVIDYIFELECTLDYHPAVLAPTQLLQAAIAERKPLSENTQLNTCYPQEV